VDLGRHIEVLWRHRIVVVTGTLLGIMLALLASFHIVWSGSGPTLVARGTEQWSAASRVLVTQTGFPWGRVTLPGAVPGDPNAAAGSTDSSASSDALKFADPSRFSSLAALYAVLSYSDEVAARIPEHPVPGQITAVPLDLNGSGSQFLPIVEITATAAGNEASKTLNKHTIEALRGLLVEEQDKNDIPRDSRIQLNTITFPTEATLLQGRSHTGSILAFMLCILGTIALAHLLESLRMRRSDDGDPTAGEVVSFNTQLFDVREPAEPVHSGSEKRTAPARSSSS
jgi:hypothetical protein